MNASTRPVQSSILDGNSFSYDDLPLLPAPDRDLVERRRTALGPSYRLFYREPLHPVRSQGCYLYDADGTAYLDAYNNVASVGHANPAVVAAVTAQMSSLSTHTRYLQAGIVEFAEQLLATFPPHIGSVMFTNSGSESNDLALRVAYEWTGGRGVVVTAEAYHGTTHLLASVSPAVGTSFGADPAVRVVPAPDPRLAAAEGKTVDVWFAEKVDAAFADLQAHGVRPAAFLADSIFSSDGIFPNEPGFLAPAVDAAHRHGALFISDEVQPGYTRTGDAFWGFARHGVAADLVTCGKPMGNGIPVAALAGRPEVIARFGSTVPYFNTFGGSSVAIAAAQAVLDYIQTQDVQAGVLRVGHALRSQVAALALDVPFIAQVRGAGLYLGVEVVDDEGAPDPARALAVVDEMRRRRVLISVAGHGNNVLKIRPPLVFGDPEVALLVERLGDSLDALGGQR